ncbi:uncharacterized protein Bfra_003089 [Botrytis fragariae]|uniref:Uncharacterized protein n=1 Tax=Botrytis fragariae TaxID=1964551 RepID=A0A8H6AZK9_9HELO|nr:uncharacterized protein Bfra_003089 [Botrytis fragariae]KAF5876683.1 hypothetical protein Bfra_003089 [Botrytis fragariae]
MAGWALGFFAHDELQKLQILLYKGEMHSLVVFATNVSFRIVVAGEDSMYLYSYGPRGYTQNILEQVEFLPDQVQHDNESFTHLKELCMASAYASATRYFELDIVSNS